ncbi:MAG TPA: NFACT RNA binding domain-containing protein [Candidatus Krumholzibacteria bacterium]|nr:NFACT RNA binding domain-containing protein [Candidatus Krumholzibacteria bacterium]
MDAVLLARFVAAQRPRLEGAKVQRLVCVGDGLVLALGTRHGTAELGLLGALGAAWAYCLHGRVREELHAELGALYPALVAPAGKELGLRLDDATALDALRAWLLRPAAAAPDWLQLEGTEIRALRTAPEDRRLWLECERLRTRETERFTLVAELFDRGANFLLLGPGDVQLANWSGRRPAPEPGSGHIAQKDKNPPSSSASTTVGLSPGANPADGDGSDNAPSLAAVAHLTLAAAAAAALARTHRQSLQREAKRVQKLLGKLEADAEHTKQAEAWRRQAELLSANLHRVQRGQEQLEVEDLYTPGARLTLSLDPSLAPHENVALFFKRARRAARGHAAVEARLQEARAAADALDARLAVFPDAGGASATDWSDVLQPARDTWKAALSSALAKAEASKLWAPGGPPWQLARPSTEAGRGAGAGRGADARRAADAGPGRRFLLAGNWEVRVGRNNGENDELTHRFAAADDVWLHASGVSGSHVVLRMQGRKDNPPREILEAAAAIAARFSQAKHARTVPVLWTRKRYVRKPRGGTPGLATCSHEKTLFVRPGLPEGPQEANDD